MKDLGIEGVKEFRRKIKFGDLVKNGYASNDNPHQVGVFVKFKRGRVNVIESTDMKGNFWTPIFDTKSKLEIVGSIFDNPSPF